MDGKGPRLTIVVVNFNTCDWLSRCLESVKRQSIADEIEVVVVDNASTDGSVGMVEHRFPQFEQIALSANAGFGKANNIGAAIGAAPWILFLNPDTEVCEGSIETMLMYLETNNQCDIVGGTILDETDKVECSTGSWPTFFSRTLDKTLDYLPKSLADSFESMSHRHRYFDAVRRVDWVTGACLWIRRALFETVTGFDTDFFYYEDVDLCYRCSQLGGQVWFVPGAPVIHYKNRSPISNRTRKRAQVKSLKIFQNKHLSCF